MGLLDGAAWEAENDYWLEKAKQEAKLEAQAAKLRAKSAKVLSDLGHQLEVVAACQIAMSFGYAQGYNHGSTLHDFCEPMAGDRTYFPLDLRYYKGVRFEA